MVTPFSAAALPKSLFRCLCVTTSLLDDDSDDDGVGEDEDFDFLVLL